MSSRSLNKVQLIGNLTRDPELRYTPTGAAVCTIGLATNRSWMMESGEKKEETEFHRVVAWNKLAELCSQLLTKGRKIYIEGRLRTNSWQTADGAQRSSTEIVIEDMILLDSRPPAQAGRPEVATEEGGSPDVHAPTPAVSTAAVSSQTTAGKKKQKKEEEKPHFAQPTPGKPVSDAPAGAEEVNPDDIPF